MLHPIKVIFAATVIVSLSSCATSELLNDSPTAYKTKRTLVEDQRVAFGRSAQPSSNMPAAKVLIIGEKNSYVLTQGGEQMVDLLTHLDPKYIRFDSDMNFYSPKNDGYFTGQMRLSYVRLKDELNRSDYQYVLQHDGSECNALSDTRMQAQRFCFTVSIKGGVYPKVSNYSLVQSKYKALTHPYAVTIYTDTANTRQSSNAAQKIGNAAVCIGV